MPAFVRLPMIMQFREAIIHVMGGNNGNNRRDQQPDMQGMPYLFCQQKQDADTEDGQGQYLPVVLSEAMA